jgi:hypothetical protein
MTAHIYHQPNPLIYPFLPDLSLWRPLEIQSYFQRDRALEIPAKHALYVLTPLTEKLLSSSSNRIQLVVSLFNEILAPLGKSCRLAFKETKDETETVQINLLDDSLCISTEKKSWEIIVL